MVVKSMDKRLMKTACICTVTYSKRLEFPINFDVDNLEHAGEALWDLTRPLEGDCTVTYYDFSSPIGKETFWHSSAHMMGEALE